MNPNLVRITGVSFLTYFIMSAMLAPIGIISTPMAEHFGQSVTDVTRQFSWLTGGTLAGAIAALLVYDLLALRRVLVVVYGLMGLILFSLFLVSSLQISTWILGAVGFGCGIGLAGAATTISRSYSDARRASMLVITDACFSIAGFVTAWTATWLIGKAFGWSAVYQLLGLVAICVCLMSAVSNFPDTLSDSEEGVDMSSWPLTVWLCIGCLLLYTLGQYSMLLWLPNYALTTLSSSNAQAGSLVGQFWLGMFFTQLFVSWWVLKIGVRRLVMIAGATTFLGSLLLWNWPDPAILPMLTLLWGFLNLGMLKALISLATEQVALPTARLVSLLLLGASIGTAVSPAITSQIVEWTDNRTILMFGSACYGLLLIVALITLKLSHKPVGDASV